VYEPVVVAAEQDEVVQTGLTALGPVADVMGIDEPPPLAAGELAASVAREQRPADRGRDRTRSSPDAERFAVSLDQGDERAIAGETPGGFRRDPRAVGNRALTRTGGARARLVGCQGLGIDVDEDLIALAARQAGGRPRER
jgi:hypothetical protein